MAELTEIRNVVRERYAAAAREGSGCGCGEGFGNTLYEGVAGGSAVNASLGCGVPTAVADLRAGETVLDHGSGAGADVLISAGRARTRPATSARPKVTARMGRSPDAPPARRERCVFPQTRCEKAVIGVLAG
ncbi:MAG: hypothetical protein ACJ76M_18725 [Solirubrobacteraceae bacterium]